MQALEASNLIDDVTLCTRQALEGCKQIALEVIHVKQALEASNLIDGVTLCR
jgi:hypothetical protein